MIILALFIVNALVSTVKGYSPKEMYGITSGILYGNIIAEGFNVIALSIFVVTLGFIEHKKVLNLIILAVTFSFIMLSLRRSVMGISAMGIGIAYLTILTKEKAKTFFAFGCLALMLGLAIVTTTDLADHFKERYELRKLDERELEEEKRFFEYELLYKDMFVYRDYSPLIGYELFNSWGNYGRGVLEERSLHGDLTSITHSTGFIGLFLYLLMVFSAFKRSFRSAESRTDMLTIIFCALSFMIYTITGRYTEIGATMMLYLVLMLPLAKKEAEAEEAQTESEVMEPNVRQKSLATTKIDTQAIHS
ncbi:O-antigen ligase family protein [Pontibacter korlensis]|nr:hypothetical protein [Pontibacter korlensis]